MQSSLEKGLISYGDVILLLFEEVAQSDMNRGLHSRTTDTENLEQVGLGFLGTMGFLEKEAYLQTIPCDNDLSYQKLMETLDEKGISNLRECMFRVCPEILIDFHKEYKQLLDSYEKICKVSSKKKRDKKSADLITYLDQKLEKMKDRVKNEKLINDQRIEECRGKTVLYGDKIMLQHVESEEYLLCSKKNSLGYKVAYKAKLDHWLSNRVHMKVHSKFKSRKFGDVLQNGDEVLFEASKPNYFLDVANDIPYYLNNFLIDLKKDKYRKEISFRELRAKKFSAVFSNNSKVSWRILLFQKYTAEEKEVNGLDLVRICHTELGGHLSSALRYKSTAPEVYIRNYTGAVDDEKYSTSSVWEIQHVKSNNLGDPIRLDAEKKSNDDEYDEIVVKSEPIKLKHYLSEKYLFAVPFKQDYLMVVSNHTKKSEKKNYVKLNLVPVMSNARNIYDGKTFALRSKSYHLRFDPKIKLTRKFLIDPNNKKDFESTFMPLNDADVDEKNLVCKMQKGSDSENAFKIVKVTRQERMDILFAKSALPYTLYFISFFSSTRLKILKPSMYRKMEKVLLKLCCFLFKTPFRPDTNIFNFDGEPDPSRQKILRELNFIDYLAELISRPFERGLIDIQMLNGTMPITRILAMSYTTIKYIIRENRTNELYCSQWLNLFLDHSLKTKSKKEIMAEKTLTELIDNNKRILTNRIGRGTVNKFIQLVSEDKISKYIEILRVIIICNGKPLTGHQREISQLLLRDKKMREKLMYKLKMDETFNKVQYCLNYNGSKWDNLDKLKTTSNFLDYLGSSPFDYFVSFTFLLGDLCLMRNYKAIETLQKFIPFEICFTIITSNDYPISIKEAFANLMTNLWVDVAPLQKVFVPNYIKLWGELKDTKYENQAIREKRDQIETLKQKVIEYLNSIEHDQFYKEEEIKFLLTMLKMMKKNVQLNLVTEEEVKHIFQILKSFLKTLVMIFQNENLQLTFLSFNQKSLLFVTSNLICSMLKMIFMYEIDKKTTKILDGLKNYMKSLETKMAYDSFEDSFYIPGEKNSLIFKIIKGNRTQEDDETMNYFEKFDEIFQETVSKDETLEINKNQDIQYLLILLAINSNNPDLVLSSMDLIYLIHSQSKKIKETFDGLQLVSKHGQNQYLEIKKLANKLNELAETCEKWFTSPHEQEQKDVAEILITLKGLLVKENFSRRSRLLQRTRTEEQLTEEDKEVQENKKKIHPIFRDRINCAFVATNSFQQDFFRNTGILRSLITLLEWDLIYHQYLSASVSKKLLTSIYEILGYCCQKNQSNKSYLLKHLSEPFFMHFHSDIEVGASAFVNHLLSGNEELTENEETVNMVIHELFRRLDSVNSKSPLRAFILKMLGNLVSNQEKNLRDTQNRVLSRLFDKKNVSFTLDINPTFLENWSNAIKNSEPVSVSRQVKGIIVPSELCFFMAYLDLLTICSSGLNSFSENISQNLVKLEDIRAILEKDLHPIIKSNVIFFFFEVYLETERENFFHFQKIVTFILNLLLDTFCDLLDNPCSKELSDIVLVTHDQCDSMSFFYNDCIIRIVQCFDNILKKNIQVNSSSKGFENLKRFYMVAMDYCDKYSAHSDRDVTSALFKLKSNLKENSNFDMNKALALRKTLLLDSERTYEDQLLTTEKSVETKSKEKKLFLQSMISGGFKRGERRISSKIKVLNYRDNDKIANIVENFTSRYFKTDLYKKRYQREFKDLVKFVTKIQDYSSIALKLKPTTFIIFYKSLIKFLHPKKKGEIKSTEDYLLGLTIFRLYIEAGNPGCPKGIANWDVDDWEDTTEEVVKRQNTLLDLDIVDLIIDILSKVDNQHIFSECVKLSIGLIIGGNEKGQKKFFQSFKQGFELKAKYKDHSQMYGLKVLNKIKEKLSKSFEIIRKNYEEKNEIMVKFKQLDSEKEKIHIKSTLKKYDKDAASSIKTAKNIYRYLQLLCEGHNSKLQNFLREQFSENDSLYSINIDFVRMTASTFGGFIKYLNPKLIGLGDQILEFLIEVVQGPCKNNQKVLYEAKVIDYCKDLMNEFSSEKDFESKGFLESKEEIEDLIKTSIKLLYSLLEANSNMEIQEYLATHIEFDYLINILTQEYKMMFKETDVTEEQLEQWTIEKLNSKLKISVFDEEMAESFDTFFLIKTLDDATGKFVYEIAKLTGIQRNAFDMFSYHSGNIEIVFRDDQVYKNYFVLQPACRNIDQSYKNDIMVDLNRDSAKEKVIDFLSNSPRVFDTIEHLSKLLKNKKFYSPTTNLYDFLRKATLAVAIVINTLVMIFFKKKLKNGGSIDDPYFDARHYVFKILGSLHLFLTILLFLVWTKVKAPMIVRKSLRAFFDSYYQKIITMKEKYEGELPDLHFKDKSLEEVSRVERIEMLKKCHEILGNKYSTPAIEYFVMINDFYFSDYDFKFIFTTMSITAAAIFMNKAFFFGTLLFDIVYHFDVLKNVMKAVVGNKESLGLTTILIFLVILFFTEFGFVYFPEDFYMSDVENGESTCTSMLHCFITVFALGPRSSGSIGDVMIDISYSQTDKYFIRLIYDFLIFSLVNIILMNVIFGIIIDTFAELRDKKKLTDFDMKNICTVCSLNRQLFDKNSKGFEYHIESEHNPWSYLFFLYGLRKKDETEYTGIESYVNDMQMDNNINWVPVMRALSLKDAEEEEVSTVEKKLDNIIGVINKVKKALQS